MSQYVFYTIIIFVVGEYLFSQWLARRNRKAASPYLPPQLSGLYDSDKYAKQQSYFKENNRLSFYSNTFSTLFILTMFITGAFGSLYEYCATISENNIVVTLIYFAILFIIYDLLSTPFAIYDTFVIEERFGFNKTTPATFILDKLKGWFIGAVLGGILISVIVIIYNKLGTDFWWAAFLVIISFSMIMTMFYSQIIVSIFNKQTPLPEGELRDAIAGFAAKGGFKLDNIYVMDGSKRSTKANAYFTGLGSKKRIVLYDTLINDLCTEEIVAVLAHEMGHYRKKHTLISFAISAVVTLIQFYILSYVLTSIDVAQAMGISTPVFAVSL
ncbi:MAG: M48 family metallopeptidase, partial [Bacteroidales bacterium]